MVEERRKKRLNKTDYTVRNVEARKTKWKHKIECCTREVIGRNFLAELIIEATSKIHYKV